MSRLFTRFTLVLTSVLALLYAYLAWRLTDGLIPRLLLALPFLLIWIVPVRYWGERREERGAVDDALHVAGYLAMGWLNFVLLLCLARDLLLALSSALPAVHQPLLQHGPALVLGGSIAALLAGFLGARRGPTPVEVQVPVPGLDPALEGFRIVQISDLHVGPTIGRDYVERVVRMANALQPDLVALTGDIVDGPVGGLADAVAPLANLQPAGRVFFVAGNHEVYAGLRAWGAQFRSLGIRTLVNEYALLEQASARLIVGGVSDPTMAAFGEALRPDAARASGRDEGAAFRLLLSHHPKLAVDAADAGFDLQLSGHTHGGQFFPWTLAVRKIHAPHALGLSRRGRMWVYVSAGSGSWGPPLRLGTKTEVTLLRLVRE
ncbi:metallophosphoesterase [Solimonas sp. K1W22B-7]|uniref:metallophosphoesterase n=1 Tax=Solimonas sp. K1W22B-7 TaxID=2303331 RepID=UPI000E337971|nr:metallophosphoesterase [Solimonas sp. K1W22B-7]AXQ27456.1 metallophosphoesterase [Solimonas sp. K1W22B-7]